MAIRHSFQTKIALTSYRPILSKAQGKRAIHDYNFPPFVDGSCRREPDFEIAFPSVTALCRKGKIAPRLFPDDIIVYLTTKGNWLDIGSKPWRLSAVLKVTERFESHREAVTWYNHKLKALPSNLVVPENPPLTYEKTFGLTQNERKASSSQTPESWIRYWNGGYCIRAKEYGIVLATRPIFLELHDPPIITENTMIEIFGKVPGLQNYKKISENQLIQLLNLGGKS